MGLIDFFNDPNSAIIFGCGVGVSAIFIIGVTKSLYGPKNDIHDDVYRHGHRSGDFTYYDGICCDMAKKNIQHNKCHTDNVKPEQSHGHTEPHV